MVLTNSTVTFTSINLAKDTPSNKSHSTQEILKQIESTIKNASQQDKYQQEEFDTRVLGRSVSTYIQNTEYRNNPTTGHPIGANKRLMGTTHQK
jgi:hypothetical protein